MQRIKDMLSPHSKHGRLLLFVLIAVALLLCYVSEIVGFTDRLLLWAGVTDHKSVPTEGEIYVHVLDVGNADAIVIFCDGCAMLIDAGDYGDGHTVTAFLKRYGVTHLDYVVATHSDEDHIGGMREVLAHVTVGEYLTSSVPMGEEPDTTAYRQLTAYLTEREITVTTAAVGTVRTLGTAEIAVLSPAMKFQETNARSLVCRVTYRQNRFLFMGDADTAVERTLLPRDIDADFLKVGHHGGDDATSEAFLSNVTPAVAVISCGKHNVYDHPHGDVLDNLRDSGAAVYRTDRHGTVTVIGDGETLSVHTEKE